MLLTDQQLHEIRQIIADHHSAFVANVIHPNAVDPETLERLRSKGLINVKINSVEDAYIYGQLLAALEDPRVAKMGYEELKLYMRRNPVPLSPIEQRAVQVAQHTAAQYAVGLGRRVDLETGQSALNVDTQLQAKMRDQIRTLTAESIAKRQSAQQLKSDLGWATKDWARDWDRIAITETNNALQRGTADHYAKRFGGNVRVAKRALPDACPRCRALHNGPDGQPRIFKLSQLERNGTNHGRKAADWLPCVTSTHPHCFPAGVKVITARGELPIEDVLLGDLVLGIDAKFEPVTALHRSVFAGELVRLTGEGWNLPVTSNHPIYSKDQWIDAGKLKEGDHVIQKYDTQGSLPVHMNGKLGAFVDVNCRCAAITAIRSMFFEGTVYNLSIAGSESYFANGILVHNCQCQLVRIPDGWGFDEQGELVPGGSFGVDYSGKEDFEMAIQEEMDLVKSVRLGHVDFQGLPIAIENAPGTTRHWKSPDGQEGDTHMLFAYGYVEDTNGVDGDAIDVFLGPDPRAQMVYVVHQQNPKTGLYDEQKCFLGFPHEQAAKLAYQEHYDCPDFAISVDPMSLDHFKRWAYSGTKEAGKVLKKGKSTTRFVIPLEKSDVPSPGLSSSGNVSPEMVETRASARAPGPGVGANYLFNTPKRGRTPTLKEQGQDIMPRDLLDNLAIRHIQGKKNKEDYEYKEPLPDGVLAKPINLPEGWPSMLQLEDKEAIEAKRKLLIKEGLKNTAAVKNKVVIG